MIDLNYLDESIDSINHRSERYKVLVVDDHVDNIHILKGILQDKYDVLVAKNGKLALTIVAAQMPDLILLDVMMPEMNGYQVCEAIKQNPNTSHIPIIFVTAMTAIEDEQEGFEVGAVDFITKPVAPLTTLARVASHLALAQQDKQNRFIIKQRTNQLREALTSAVKMLSEAGTYNDEMTGNHMWRMADYCAVLAEALGWDEQSIENIHLAAPLHDTGKIGIPDSILKAPRKLTAEEWEVMKQHPTIGADILGNSDAPLFKMAAEVSLGHHEKWDGTGYPSGLVGEEIPLTARIVAIADVFDALTMERPYKKAWPIEEAYQYLRDNAGKHFDPKLVDCFIKQDSKIRMVKKKWEQEGEMK